MHLLSLIAALLLAIYISETVCPPNFKENEYGVCVTQVGRSGTFCEAVEKCEKYGKSIGSDLFLVGRDSTVIRTLFPGGQSIFWTGVNQLLVRRDTAKDGWYDTNPETPAYTTEKNFPWCATQPDGNGPVTVYNRSDDLFYDYALTAKPINLDVFCQYTGDPSNTVSAVKFTTNFPVKLVDFIQKNSNFFGCFPGTITESTPLRCAMSCASNSACRSVYVNVFDGECVPVMYADSLLPWDIAKSTDGWKRFAKTEIREP
ncbi:hypothetical protein PHET_02722 [Paragonimus heterotremus]|uniref:PAN-3 domain-containing protein n=1 Tax=Paragonimus heterotremus TaxID=100268 RepID=A0A8J4TFK4_9TREM|nr:hypothetical protein PHET_02722 [Paragonimus heterotremus]